MDKITSVQHLPSNKMSTDNIIKKPVPFESGGDEPVFFPLDHPGSVVSVEISRGNQSLRTPGAFRELDNGEILRRLSREAVRGGLNTRKVGCSLLDLERLAESRLSSDGAEVEGLYCAYLALGIVGE